MSKPTQIPISAELVDGLKRARRQMDHMLATHGYVDINALDPEAPDIDEKLSGDATYDALHAERGR